MDLRNFFNIKNCLTYLLILLFAVECRACFIRNCPPGGKKRSNDLLPRPSHQCLPCGPELRGQCVGPNTCCGDFGCLMGTVETQVCDKEDDSSEPCAIRGEPCGRNGQGNCVAMGICCNADACSYNVKCRKGNSKDDHDILSLLNRILQSQDYPDD